MQFKESFPGEQALLQQLKADDATAFTKLFNRFADPVLTYIRYRLCDADEAEDILQVVFTKLWFKRHAIQVNTSFKNYLYTIVQRCIVDHVRHCQRRRWTTTAELPDIQEATARPEDQYHYKQVYQLWKVAVKRLPQQMQKMYALKNEQQLSVKEIADHMNVSEQTVKNQLHTAGRRVAEILRQVQFLFF